MGKEDIKGKPPEERGKKAAGGSGKSQVPKEMIPKDKREEENKEISPMPEMATSRDETAAAGFEIKEKQFEKIMERLIRQLENGEKKEERYRRLDAAIRRHQQSRKMAAATEENSRKRKKRNKKKS